MTINFPSLTGPVYDMSIRTSRTSAPRLLRVCKACGAMFDATNRHRRLTCSPICATICRISGTKRAAKARV